MVRRPARRTSSGSANFATASGCTRPTCSTSVDCHPAAEVRPQEVYNLAAQSFVPTSWRQPLLTGEFTALGVTRMLEAVRLVDPGDPLLPGQLQRDVRQGPRGAAERADALLAPQSLRGGQGLRALDHGQLSGELRHFRLFGDPVQPRIARRGKEFVSRKISDGVARIKLGLQKELCWAISTPSATGAIAGDYVQAMWMMLQQDKPEDFVIATGVKHSVREMAELAFSYVGLDWREHVKVAPQLLRPAEINTLRGDAAKARRVLGWSPRVGFADLVRMMVDADMARVRRELSEPAIEPGAPFQGESA